MTAAIGGALTPLVYVTLVPSAAVTLSTTPTFTFSLPAGFSLTAGSSVYVGFYDPSQSATGWQVLLGPGSVSGQTITFAAVNRTVTLVANATYVFALFSTGQVLAPVAPSPSPSPSPTASPTVAPNGVFNAPLSSAPGLTPSSFRRAAASATATPSAAPVALIVEGTGTSAIWGANWITWVTNQQTGLDVPETSATMTGTNGLLIDNPAITPLSCVTNITSSQWCSAHPTGWFWGTDSGLVKPLGKQTITVKFGDGTTGFITDDVYNGWFLACGQSVAYQNNVMVTVTSGADVTYDCTNQQVVFPHGVVTGAQPQMDAYGRTEIVITKVLAAVPVPNGSPTTIPWSSFPANAVLVFGTSDGGYAKAYVSAAGGLNWSATSLHAQADGSYAY